MILAQNLQKVFTRARQQEGRFATIRTLLSRQNEAIHAVTDVSFKIDKGEIVGYLGPNGAGKSTTIKILTGILVPTGGTVEVAGLVPWKHRQANAANIGVVFGQRTQLWWALPLKESLGLIGRMYRMSERDYKRQMDMLVELLGMQSFLQTPVRQLSLGQRMRGDLAAAVLYQPPVLFLDEPTIGLDVVVKERIRSFIEAINREQKTTVLLTTHDLDDVERLCKRIIIMDEGKVVFDGPVDSIKHRFAPTRMIDITVDFGACDRMRTALSDLPRGITVTRRENVRATLEIEPETIATSDAIALLAARLPIVDLGVRERGLESIIHDIYKDQEFRS